MNQILSPGARTGLIRIPASKSQAHRMLICAALSNAPSALVLDGLSEDIEATIHCLSALGAQIFVEPQMLRITPITAVPKHAALDVGESGSTLRFLLPIVGALGIQTEIRMHGRLPERPLSPLWELLERGGMRLRRDGSTLYTDGQLRAGDYCLPGSVSSQFISGLLFALPLLNAPSTLRVTDSLQSAQYVAMTEQALVSAKIRLSGAEQVWQIPGNQQYQAPAVQRVEGDWSNAAFFLCMGALSARGVTVTGLNPDSLQADRAIVGLLRQFGAVVQCREDTVTVQRGSLRAISLDAGGIPDLIPVVCALAAFCPGKTEIQNAARLRLKESDRLRSTAQMLTALGALAEERSDGLIVTGKPALPGGTVDACGDHRIAMSAAMAACGCTGDVRILGAQCVAKSYPAFWNDYASLKEASQ